MGGQAPDVKKVMKGVGDSRHRQPANWEWAKGWTRGGWGGCMYPKKSTCLALV